MSKQLIAMIKRNPARFRDDWYRDSDGYWVHLQKGWQIAPHTACHTLHEINVQDILLAARHVCKCDCEDCRK